MKLENRVAVITGTSPNIGGGIAEALAGAGAAIVAVDHSEANAADCAEAIRRAGGRAMAIACDVTDEVQARTAIERTVAEFGSVDILVNNAATFNKKGVLDMSFAEWERQSRIILDGTFLFTKYAAASMVKARRGVIINIISTAGHQGEPRNIAYSTAKGGLLNFTRSAAMELARHGIRVVSLTPTATDPYEQLERAARWGRTPEPLPDIYVPIFERFRKRLPMQSLPKPTDYGAAAVFLASDDASMISGSDLSVDAGALARYWAWQPEDDA
jgi:NAD(P)-dependent dehydrogenase (short-subunit alcohol dehydrogenase family)